MDLQSALNKLTLDEPATWSPVPFGRQPQPAPREEVPAAVKEASRP